MDEMLRYIFKSMKNYDQEFLATAKGFAAVTKFVKAQNKVNMVLHQQSSIIRSVTSVMWTTSSQNVVLCS